ncbi:MAG: NUDIX hydrolase [bacterium]
MNKTPLTNEYVDQSGVKCVFEYHECDSFGHLLSKKVTQAYGVCFVGDKIVIVYSSKNNHWILPGGSIEKGETFEECLKREIKEESNMRVISFMPIGYQEVRIEGRILNQLRYFCIVEPYGDFISDPDGSITKIKLIDPRDYKQYFDWGEIGDKIMERAIELKNNIIV